MVVGSPVRAELLERRTKSELAKEALGFTAAHPLILIIGGSQGSLSINNFILTNLPAIIAMAQVLHQTGIPHFGEIEKLSRAALANQPPTANRYLPVNYFTEDYPTALDAADVVIARAGSGTIFEIAAFGKPAILIPLPGSANGHQRANAYSFAEAGGGIVIEEANLLPGIFLNELKKILDNGELRGKMAAASGKVFRGWRCGKGCRRDNQNGGVADPSLQNGIFLLK